VTSTLLSLVIIPVVFTYFDDLQRWATPKLKRLLTIDHPHPERPAVLPSAE